MRAAVMVFAARVFMLSNYSIGCSMHAATAALLNEKRWYNGTMDDSRVGQYLNQLLRGLIEPLLLYIISELPSHGYRIAKELERRSCGYFSLTASTVYSALRRLEEEGLVLSDWQRVASSQRRRCYYLTDKGRRMLKLKVAEWERFSSAAEQVITNS